MDQEIANNFVEIMQKRLGDVKCCLNTVYNEINECVRKGIIDEKNAQKIDEELNEVYSEIQKVVKRVREINN